MNIYFRCAVQAVLPVSTTSHLYCKWEEMSMTTAPSPGPPPQCLHILLNKEYFCCFLQCLWLVCHSNYEHVIEPFSSWTYLMPIMIHSWELNTPCWLPQFKTKSTNYRWCNYRNESNIIKGMSDSINLKFYYLFCSCLTHRAKHIQYMYTLCV